jgi:hypothetical protein
MSFTNSSQVKVPLTNPYVKYGKTFRISNLYIESSNLEQTISELNPSSMRRSNYAQNFQTSDLNLRWEVIDPRDDYIYKTSGDIERNVYISGFNIDIYENFGDLTGQNAINNGTKIYSESDIKGNSFNYKIEEENKKRNYSIELTLIDFTGNQNKALLTTKNPEPEFNILSTGLESGFFYCNYEKITGENGEILSNDLQSVDLYNFTGINQGNFPGYEESVRYSIGENGYASVELTPDADNYVMAVPSDLYSSGQVSGFFRQNSNIPLLIDYNVEITNLTGYRLSGGDAFLNSFKVNYNTGSDLITSCYGVTGTGQTTGSVSGYNKPIFFDSGQLFNTDYGYGNTENQYIFDNSLSVQSGFATGVIVKQEYLTGINFTGSGVFGSGAGGYWEESFPKYRDDTVTGENGGATLVYNSEPYIYGYYDSQIDKFKCATYMDVKSGDSLNINGIYSMPKNSPNSYDIQYHSGPNFQKTYEQSASYLNSIDRMPAVILNPSQLSKIKSINGGVGWVGLRRETVVVADRIFSNNFINQTFFDEINIKNESTRDISINNLDGTTEESKLIVNQIGDYWSWTNSSGTEIYKYAGSGYEKTRQMEVSFGIKNQQGESIYSTGYTAEIIPPKIKNITGTSGNITLSLEYEFEQDYYLDGQNPDNYNTVQVNLYTGRDENFQISNANLYEEFTLENSEYDIQKNISFEALPGEDFPSGFKMLPFDTIGSGHLANVNDFIGDVGFTADFQSFSYSLDAMKDLNTNCVEVQFPQKQSSAPVVTFGLQYTGQNQSAQYLGAMIVGQPTVSSVNFVLTNPPNDYGYVLNISTN